MDISFNNVDDAAGYAEKQHRWVYYKPLLFDALGVPHGVYPQKPESYPVVLKPVINLEGLSAGARLAYCEDDVEFQPGYFWMPVLKGRHVSLDLLVRRGVVQLLEVAVGHPADWFGGFDYWEAEKPTAEDRKLAGIVARKLGLRNGRFNVECIGDTVIEFHLRRSVEFDPILRGSFRYAAAVYASCRMWIAEEAMVEFLDTLRVPQHAHTLHDGGWPETSSSGRCRYAILYGDDLSRLRAARTEVIKSLGRLAKLRK